MRLVVTVPHEIEVDLAVTKVRGEGLHGSFTLLPRHIDTVVMLETGILSYVDEHGVERFAAVDGGTLTKVGDEVRVATIAAVQGDRLDQLERTVEEALRRLDERERAARTALARIEGHVLEEMFEFEEGT